MKDMNELKDLLRRIDHKGYPAYKDTKGIYQFTNYILDIEHIQGDPFASPSNIKIIIKGKTADIPEIYYNKKCKRIMLQDYLLRQFGKKIEKYSFLAKGSGKSGLMSISKCGQEILERSACQINAENGDIIIRMEIGFPANGRSINSGELIKILFDFLPRVVNETMLYKNIDKTAIEKNCRLSEEQEYIRKELKKHGLIAFVANGSILPRESGISGKPLKNAVKFRTPQSMNVEMNLPYSGLVNGMGIPQGITLIVGGGYHGKSTLLEALEKGVYNHILGDGREFVITDETAMKIRAEDGRSIRQVDISMFIQNLPNKIDTTSFYTEDASGSTSQAANVAEAIEADCNILLIDEDTSATNFMIRDDLMQRVIKREHEPIIPYIERIRELYDKFGISTILVAGSSGAYFEKADVIIQMESYSAYDITEYAKKEAKKYIAEKSVETIKNDNVVLPNMERKVCAYKDWQGDRVKIKINGLDSVLIQKNCIDMRYVEQLVDNEQLRTLGYIIKYINEKMFNDKANLRDVVECTWDLIEQKGIAGICMNRYLPSNLAMPRKQEIYACINRCRQLKVKCE